MKNYKYLKLICIAILCMITLIIFSVAEVAVYSYAVNPGQTVAIYQQHALVSAPWVAGIGGFVLFFLIARYWSKNQFNNVFQLAILLPVIYTTLDLTILLIEGSAEWGSFIWVFILTTGARFLGSYLGYKLST